MTPHNFYIQNPSLADFVESDEEVLKFFNEGGFYPHIIERLFEVIEMNLGNRYPLDIDLKTVLNLASNLCSKSLADARPVQAAKTILSHFELDHRSREVQLIAGIAYALLYTNFDKGRQSYKLADYLDSHYCTNRYSLFHRGKTLLKRLQKGEITIEQVEKPQPIDYNKPLSLEQEKSVLKMRKDTHTLYCVGDIVQAKNNSGEFVPVKITKIRNNGLSFTNDVEHARIAISDTRLMIDRLVDLLGSIENVTTLPALNVMFGVVLMELDYLYVRLSGDQALMEGGFFFTLGANDDRHDYGKYIEKLKAALMRWNRRSTDGKDDACYFNPGFDYGQFEEKFVAFSNALHDKGNAVLELLKEMDATIKRPGQEKILKMYSLLHQIYMHGAYAHDLEEYETFHIGVTRFNTIKLLTDKISEMERDLEDLKVFEKFGYDLPTVICKLYSKSQNKWDEEALAKHFFAHRKELTQEQLNVFFKYVEIGGMMKHELDEFRKTPDAVMVTPPTAFAQPVAPNVPSPQTASTDISTLLRQLATTNGVPVVNLTVVNGENRVIQPDNYGENIFMGPNGRIVRENTDEYEEPRQ